MAALIAWKNLADTAVWTVETGALDPNFTLSSALRRGLAEEVHSVPAGPSDPLRLIADNRNAPFEWMDPSFQASVNAIVEAFAVQPDGKVLIAGDFTAVGGVTRNRIARLNHDGTLDTEFDPNANARVVAIALQPDGKVLIAGEFTTVGGVSCSRIARLNPDGSLDTSFSTPAPNNTINAMVLLPNGNIVVAGAFTSFGGITTRQRLALLSSTGGVLPGWSLSINNVVNTLALQPDGKVLLGGVFTLVGGSVRNRIARLTADGSLDAGFVASVNGAVHAIALQPDGKVLIGGLFSAVGGFAQGNMARLLDGGAVDTGFINLGTNASVNAIAVVSGGLIFAGGAFTEVGGIPVRRLAVFRPGGELDTRFLSTINGQVSAIALDSDGRVLIGGSSSSAATRVMRVLSAAPDKIRIIAVLGVGREYTGSIIVSHRADPSAAWTELGSINAGILQAMGTYLPTHLVFYLDQPLPAAGQIRLEFPESDTTPLSFGRLWFGDALVLPDGVDAGWSMSFRDSGSLDATDGQQWVESPGVITRVLTVPLEGARNTETHWGWKDGGSYVTNRMSLNALQLEAGTTGEVIAVARTSTDLWTQRTTVYGHIEQPWAIGHTAGPHWAATLTIVEER